MARDGELIPGPPVPKANALPTTPCRPLIIKLRELGFDTQLWFERNPLQVTSHQ